MASGSSSSLAMLLLWEAATCSRTWIQVPWEGIRELLTGQEDLWEYLPGTWDNGDSVPLAWEHLGGRPRPQKTTSFHEGPAS